MKPFYRTIFLAVIFILLEGVNCKVLPQSEKNFNFFYSKASGYVNSNLDSASIYSTKALLVAEKEQLWSAYFLQALIYKKKKEYHQSVIYYNLSADHADSEVQRLYTFGNMANALYEKRDYNLALKYAYKVVNESPTGSHKYIYNVYGVIAKSYGKMGLLDSARKYFKVAIGSVNKKHDKDREVTAGFMMAKGDMLVHFNKIDSGMRHYMKAYDIRVKQEKKGNYKLCGTLLAIAECHIKRSNYKEAERYLSLAKELKLTHIGCNARLLKLYGELYYSRRMYKELEVAYNKLDSILLQSAEKLLNEDHDMYTKTRDGMHKKMIFLAQTERQKANTRLYIIVIICGVFLFGSTFFVWAMRATKVRQRKLEDRLEKRDWLLGEYEKKTLESSARIKRLNTEHERLASVSDGQEQLVFWMEAIKVYHENHVINDIRKMLLRKESHDTLLGVVDIYISDFEKFDSIINTFLENHNCFIINLDNTLVLKQIKLTEKQRMLCLLSAMKIYGIDNRFIQHVLDYHDHTGLKALKKRTVKKFGISLDEFDQFIVNLM